MVYQHTTLVPTLTVLENLMLGEAQAHPARRARAARQRLAELGGHRSASMSTPDATTGSLALGQQQQIEIIKALWRGSKVLILDEPTSMLTPQGVAELEQVHRPPQGARPRRRLHHPQAPRGDLAWATASRC